MKRFVGFSHCRLVRQCTRYKLSFQMKKFINLNQMNEQSLCISEDPPYDGTEWIKKEKMEDQSGLLDSECITSTGISPHEEFASQNVVVKLENVYNEENSNESFKFVESDQEKIITSDLSTSCRREGQFSKFSAHDYCVTQKPAEIDAFKCSMPSKFESNLENSILAALLQGSKPSEKNPRQCHAGAAENPSSEIRSRAQSGSLQYMSTNGASTEVEFKNVALTNSDSKENGSLQSSESTSFIPNYEKTFSWVHDPATLSTSVEFETRIPTQTRMNCSPAEFDADFNDSSMSSVSSVSKSLVQGNDSSVEGISSTEQDALIDSNKKIFTCNQCSAQLTTKQNLQRHALTHTTDRPFACNQCAARFKSKKYLQKHLKGHSDQKAFSCDECPARFKKKIELHKHSLTHIQGNPFVCNQCSAPFRTEDDLQNHLMNVHPKERPVSCDECSARFRNKRDLHKHMSVIHTEARPFSCAQCSACFKRKNDLLRHSYIHAERAFSCNQCSESFKCKYTLKRHLFTHTEEKPFPCDHCPVRFRTKRGLQNHLLTHTEERSFAALHCTTELKNEKARGKHLPSHTNGWGLSGLNSSLNEGKNSVAGALNSDSTNFEFIDCSIEVKKENLSEVHDIDQFPESSFEE